MINLRYHIVSLTAVFLAIGIGLTLGSTFLDRATVDNLNGQLEGLETRLDDREKRISELEDETDRLAERDAALDEQANVLLTDRLSEVPVVLLAARGVEEADVQDTVQALVAASADVQGVWWLTERWSTDWSLVMPCQDFLSEKSGPWISVSPPRRTFFLLEKTGPWDVW